MFQKALDCGTDIVCVELEDGIAPRDKLLARKNAIELLRKIKTKMGSNAY